MKRRKLFGMLAALPAAFLIPKISLPRDVDEITKKYPPEYGEAVEWNRSSGYQSSATATRRDGLLLESEPMRLASGYVNFKTSVEWIAAMPHHLAFLHSRARRCLPIGYHYEIRSKALGNYGMSFGVAWYNNPSINKLPLVEPMQYPGTLNQLGRSFLMGRFRA